ncbi:coiled-coil domain-containing protein 85B, partial [Cetorhinus maximus]
MSGAGEGESPPADLSQLSEADLLAWGKEELVRRLRRAEADKLAALVQRGRLMQEVNRRLQGHLREVRELKAVNGRLQEENRELRDLCCFLDEERLRAKGLAHEWQAFGRYAARVMREDVGGYLRKLAHLERRQEALVRENLDLRELCSARREEEEEEEERDGDPAANAATIIAATASDASP